MRSITIAAIAAAIAIPAHAAPSGVADDFESYAPGAFPSALWLDAGALDPSPLRPATLPSATVALTTDAFGAPTQALSINDEVALISGIYQFIPVSTRYQLSADIRVDRFSNGTGGPAEDFAPQLSFTRAIRSFFSTPQVGIYASSFTQGWRLYVLDETGPLILQDIDLGAAVALGQWYRVSLAIDTSDGSYRAIVADSAMGTVFVDRSDVIAGWGPGRGQFDSVAFIEGEGSLDTTIGHLGFVDNINVTATPAPAALALFGMGTAMLLGARGSRRRYP